MPSSRVPTISLVFEWTAVIEIHPILWSFLGYEFEAASMLAAVSACLIVRAWVCLNHPPENYRARGLSFVVMLIAMLFAAGWVILQRPSPFYGLLSGSGFGALGSGIIAMSLNWVRRFEPLDDGGSAAPLIQEPRSAQKRPTHDHSGSHRTRKERSGHAKP